jgi:PKD repeat protein
MVGYMKLFRLSILMIMVLLIIGTVSAISQYNITVGSANVIIFNGTPGVTTWTAPSGVINISYLVVAGGGGGGGDLGAIAPVGGGGAGGLLYCLTYTVVPGTAYNVTVGAGGLNGTPGRTEANSGRNGTNSSFANSTIANGIQAKGGAGGTWWPAGLGVSGYTGGSGAGASGNWSVYGYTTGAVGISGQGNNGGRAHYVSGGASCGGGGGGAGGSGTDAFSSAGKCTAGSGGAGLSYSISGTSQYYAGGGGTTGYSGIIFASNGGSGIGGNGNNVSSPNKGGDAVKNTGSGGAGGGNGGNGSAGIVILQYINTTLAEFNSNVTSGQSPLPVNFTDLSSPVPSSWLWEFGDGNISTSQNPTYTYPSVGNYTITLTVTGAGGSNYTMKINNITVLNSPYVPLTNSQFEYGNGSGFSDIGGWVGSEKYGWSIGTTDTSAVDAYFMFDTNVSHSGNKSINLTTTVNSPGNYSILWNNIYGQLPSHHLIVEPNTTYNFSVWVKARDLSIPSATAIRFLTGVNGGFTFNGSQFVQSSATHDWEMYTTSYTTPIQNTILDIQAYMYSGTGTIWMDDIKLMKMLTPKFYANKTFGSYPLPVSFIGSATNGTVSYWNWSFGDGNYSTLQNPIFTYNTVGNYTVKLTVANGIGNENPSSITSTNYITVLPLSPISNFTENVSSGFPPFAVQFTDTSTRTPDGWSWYFGDEQYNQSWVKQSSTAGWISRYWSTAVATPDGDVILMGGINPPSNFLNDTWRSTDKGVTWTLVNASSGWASRYALSSAVLSDGTIIIFGGSSTTGLMNDTWRSTDKGVTWTLVNASSGWASRYSVASTVLFNDNIILAGGYGENFKNDTWRSTDKGTTWNLMNASSGWAGRLRSTLVSMQDGSLILAGGQIDGTGFTTVNDTWRSIDKGATWNLMNASGGWNSRLDIVSASMPDNSMIITAGYNETTHGLNDTWRTIDNGLHWSLVNANSGFTKRWVTESTSLNDGSVVMIGGYDEINPDALNETWRFNPMGSSLQNPVHIYTNTGNYTVRLQSYNRGGFNLSSAQYKTARGPIISRFIQNDSYGTTLVPVLFTDMSTESPISWQWNATNVTGNNTPIIIGNSQNLTTIFDVGNWQIKLKATNIDGSNISTQNSWVNVTQLPPISGFTENVSTGTVPLSILFTDTSTRNPDGWSWYFGDENYSQSWVKVNSNGGWLTERKSVVMSDGSIISTGMYPNDTWISTNNGSNWYLVNNQNGWTTPKSGYGLVRLSDDSIVLTGGNSTNWDPIYYYGKETWSSVDKGVTWTLTNGSSWDYSLSDVTTVVYPDDTIVLIGGRSNFFGLETHHTESWISTDKGATWSHNGDLGLGRWGADGVILSNGNIVIIGGSYNIYDGIHYHQTSYNDSWVSTNRGSTWTQVNTSIFPSPKSQSSSVVMPDGSIILTGGIDHAAFTSFNDTWRSIDGGITWNILNLSSGWPIRYNHNLVMTSNGSILFIGYNPADVWSFNPAGSSIQNPTHTYMAYGNYSVKLLSYNSGGWNISSLIQYIMVNSPPLAQFTVNITSGYGPMPIGFTDTSLYSPTEWNWSYTDIMGNNTDIWFSQIQNPTSILSPGNWSIRLNATNIYGSNISIRNITFVNVTGPVSMFGNNITGGINTATVQFIDNSIAGSPITSWIWNATDIGGSNIPFDFSYDQYPVRTFSIGNYTIVLTIVDSYGYTATSAQTTFINVSSFGNASTVTYPPTIIPPYLVTSFVIKDNIPYVNTKIDITTGMAYDNISTLYTSGYTDSSGKYVFTANNGQYYKISVNNGEYIHIYMGSSTYTTITLNVPSGKLLTRPYEYSSLYDDATNTIITSYNDVDIADVGISIVDITFNGMNVHTVNYSSTRGVADVFTVPYPTHEYKVNIQFTRSVNPSHIYSDNIYLKTSAFNNVVYNVSDQWKLFIYALYSIIMMIVSLSVGYASPKIGSVLLLGLTILGISMGLLPYNMYMGGVLVCGFIAMLEVMRRRSN